MRYLAQLSSVIILLCFGESLILAEPWLASRFSQNCAGCHAIGRKNVHAMDRRCTLACQGCHISPQGGGMRSEYGKWNQSRWLRSFRMNFLRHAKTPEPYKEQLYGKNPWEKAEKDQKEVFVEQGAPHMESSRQYATERNFDRRDGLEFKTVKSRAEFLYQIPQGDPYRDLKLNNLTAGADLRWQVDNRTTEQKTDAGTTKTESWKSFPMASDLGISWRPFYSNLRVTYEGRALGYPGGGQNKPINYLKTMTRRNLYAMAENLPFNTYIMWGYYRPIFGNFVPDHTALTQRMIANLSHSSKKAYKMQYEAVSIGGSPNMPYANLHLITKEINDSGADSSYKAYAANLGGRFVTLGLSFNYSYWRSSRDQTITATSGDYVVNAQTEMHSISTSAHFFHKLTITLEGISMAKDVPDQDYRQGAVYCVDSYLKLWREIYLNAQLSTASTNEDLYPGSSQQFRLGLRGFWIPGFETMLHYSYDLQKTAAKGSTAASEYTQSGLLYQIHMFI